jgi:hypothetical protein
MISSRSDRFSLPDGAGGSISLRDARLQLKADLENAEYLGSSLIDVWINEAEDGDHSETAWDECILQAESCDLFISLYDGSAGWAPTGGAVGICQAEFDAALRLAPGKVKVIRLPGAKMKAGNTLDQRFQEALSKASRFETHVKTDWPDLRSRVHGLVNQMVLGAAQEGVRERRKSGANVGQALDWSRMTFPERSGAIATTISGSLVDRGATLLDGSVRASTPLAGSEILFCCHGAPRSLSYSAAREFVGQPFLRDHQMVDGATSDVSGPVHLVGCPKSVTESQAVNLLGFPDFTVVEGSFGVYAADKTLMVQLCLLRDCADPGSTRNAVGRFFEWLERSGELSLLSERAASRRRIIDAILAEQ